MLCYDGVPSFCFGYLSRIFLNHCDRSFSQVFGAVDVPQQNELTNVFCIYIIDKSFFTVLLQVL